MWRKAYVLRERKNLLTISPFPYPLFAFGLVLIVCDANVCTILLRAETDQQKFSLLPIRHRSVHGLFVELSYSVYNILVGFFEKIDFDLPRIVLSVWKLTTIETTEFDACRLHRFQVIYTDNEQLVLPPKAKKKISAMLDIKGSADYLSRSTGSFSNFSMLFAGNTKDSYMNHFSSIYYIPFHFATFVAH